MSAMLSRHARHCITTEDSRETVPWQGFRNVGHGATSNTDTLDITQPPLPNLAFGDVRNAG